MKTLLVPFVPLLLATVTVAQMSSAVDPLSFRVTDAEFSAQLRKIVVVSDSPRKSLWIYSPSAKDAVELSLPLTGKSVSVSPDGLEAVVAHDGWISHVDLKTVTILDRIPVSVDPSDVVMAGNGWAYVFPATGQWVRIHCVDLSARSVTQSTGRLVRHGTLAKLHPDGTSIYGANNGVSPSDIEKYDITEGTAVYLYDSPYHGHYSFGGNLWIAEDGERIFARSGNVFRASSVRASDMTYNGQLSKLALTRWVTHSQGADRVLAIPETLRSGPTAEDTELHVYDYEFLAHLGSHKFPATDINGVEYSNHGRYAFTESNGSRAWAIVQLDSSSAALKDYGVARFDLKPGQDSLSVDVEVISIGTGGAQTMSIDAGQQHARDQYYVLGSLNGTTPGIPVDGVVIPLNFEPVYLMHTFAYPNQWPLSNSIGLLDAQGKATCKFSITANSLPTVFAGLRLHHAVAVGRGDKVVFASNPAPLRLTH